MENIVDSVLLLLWLFVVVFSILAVNKLGNMISKEQGHRSTLRCNSIVHTVSCTVFVALSKSESYKDTQTLRS